MLPAGKNSSMSSRIAVAQGAQRQKTPPTVGSSPESRRRDPTGPPEPPRPRGCVAPGRRRVLGRRRDDPTCDEMRPRALAVGHPPGSSIASLPALGSRGRRAPTASVGPGGSRVLRRSSAKSCARRRTFIARRGRRGSSGRPAAITSCVEPVDGVGERGPEVRFDFKRHAPPSGEALHPIVHQFAPSWPVPSARPKRRPAAPPARCARFGRGLAPLLHPARRTLLREARRSAPPR